MLAKRIIACLDVKNGKVVKGIKFRNQIIIGEILDLAEYYSLNGIDELVFYDISASPKHELLDIKWISKIAEIINIPFSVAGGISSVKDAKLILSSGADKISINSSALKYPRLISDLVDRFGSQCIVVGVDSWFNIDKKKYQVYQYTGDEHKSIKTSWDTLEWIRYVQKLGAGEIVVNTMNTDGTREGYDIIQLKKIRRICTVPLIASGGAGKIDDFLNVFQIAKVDGALAASVFHKNIISISNLKNFLFNHGIRVRVC
ncbi:imidazole glycerol phosphate synthase subunit HisF [Buchnera aphidicola]|uniref:imidazole glycerol-phosphate synthase n=1 Tax=Buchnera aphidicola subsp. Cinara cedri (strain Cc) TaxID=372461 RepID=Q058A2_BUCCC|nr:imidazole glycerol phosphate synthase subunit HisF [Buchnera aphidicola]ABJ90547.1 cyclase [Buchnera aphidicola BCc]